MTTNLSCEPLGSLPSGYVCTWCSVSGLWLSHALLSTAGNDISYTPLQLYFQWEVQATDRDQEEGRNCPSTPKLGWHFWQEQLSVTSIQPSCSSGEVPGAAGAMVGAEGALAAPDAHTACMDSSSSPTSRWLWPPGFLQCWWVF